MYRMVDNLSIVDVDPNLHYRRRDPRYFEKVLGSFTGQLIVTNVF